MLAPIVDHRVGRRLLPNAPGRTTAHQESVALMPLESDHTAEPQVIRRRLSRRGLLKASLIGAAGLAGWTVLIEPRWIEVGTHTLAVPGLPPQWQEKWLVHISDLHIGRVPTGYLQRAMRVVNSLQPDLLVITGDLVDQSWRRDGGLQSVLEVLKPARIASLACLGNHDYGPGWSDEQTAATVSRVANDCGIRVLRNELMTIEGLDFLGIDDYWSPRFDPQPTLARANPQRAAICLCHNPDACDLFDWSAFRGVVLAGHTHGGQCKPPFLPPPVLPVINHRYTAGLFDLAAGQQLYISRGLGHTRQVRFNCRPEITLLKLRSGGSTLQSTGA